MADFQTILTSAKSKVPNCIGIGYVDLKEGQLLASVTDGEHPELIKSLLGAATAEQLQGPTVQAIEKGFAELRGRSSVQREIVEGYFKTRRDLKHYLYRCLRREDRGQEHAVVFVAKGGTIGMLASKSAEVFPHIEGAF